MHAVVFRTDDRQHIVNRFFQPDIDLENLEKEISQEKSKEMEVLEKLKADDDALALIARQAAGGMRDAISLLDQLASTGQTITLELAQTVLGAATGQAVLDLIDALLAGNSAAGRY